MDNYFVTLPGRRCRRKAAKIFGMILQSVLVALILFMTESFRAIHLMGDEQLVEIGFSESSRRRKNPFLFRLRRTPDNE